VKFVFGAKIVSIVVAAAFTALVAGAALAAAEPAPAPPPIPTPALVPVDALPAAADVPSQAVTNTAGEPVAEGVPHLPSPENLPPGTSVAPENPNQPRLTYVRDLWHAMRTQEVSGGDALLLLTQRPMDADATSSRGLPSGPQTQLPTEPAPDVPVPADAPPLAP
jgi:glucose/arabinose dehydrogenase